jgi:hypothetical protein
MLLLFSRCNLFPYLNSILSEEEGTSSLYCQMHWKELNKLVWLVGALRWKQRQLPFTYITSVKKYIFLVNYFLIFWYHFMLFSQGPAQAQNLRDSLLDAKSDIVVKVYTICNQGSQNRNGNRNRQVDLWIGIGRISLNRLNRIGNLDFKKKTYFSLKK